MTRSSAQRAAQHGVRPSPWLLLQRWWRSCHELISGRVCSLRIWGDVIRSRPRWKVVREKKKKRTTTQCNALQHTAIHCNTFLDVFVCVLDVGGCDPLEATMRSSKGKQKRHTATRCNTLQHISKCVCVCGGYVGMWTARGQDAKGQGRKKETHYNTLQHAAKCVCVCGGYGGCDLLEAKIESGNAGRKKAHCNTLQHAATHCNKLQHTATHCNTLLNAFVRVMGMGDCELLDERTQIGTIFILKQQPKTSISPPHHWDLLEAKMQSGTLFIFNNTKELKKMSCSFNTANRSRSRGTLCSSVLQCVFFSLTIVIPRLFVPLPLRSARG